MVPGHVQVGVKHVRTIREGKRRENFETVTAAGTLVTEPNESIIATGLELKITRESSSTSIDQNRLGVENEALVSKQIEHLPVRTLCPGH